MCLLFPNPIPLNPDLFARSYEHFSKYFLSSNSSFVQVFNRDEPDREKKIHVTVKASDRGKPPLEDVCTIAVTIKDINDNPPIFDRANYEILVPQVRLYSYFYTFMSDLISIYSLFN